MTKAKELKLLPKRTRPTAPTNPHHRIVSGVGRVMGGIGPITSSAGQYPSLGRRQIPGARSNLRQRYFLCVPHWLPMEGVRFNGNLLRLHGPSAVSTMGRRGVFLQLWQTGLERYDELKGLDWSWLSMDGAITKAPLGGGENRSQPY